MSFDNIGIWRKKQEYTIIVKFYDIDFERKGEYNLIETILLQKK